MQIVDKKHIPLWIVLLAVVGACTKEEAVTGGDNYEVSTLAGGGDGFADGTGSAARFSGPEGMWLDGEGSLYVADAGNTRVRKVTPAGVVTTVVNGITAAVPFISLHDVAKDAAGNLYITTGFNILKITTAGTVTNYTGEDRSGYADGPIATAKFGILRGITVDTQGTLYVVDAGNNCIRKIAAGVVTTLAGNVVAGFADGSGTAAKFYNPLGITTDGAGTLYVADYANRHIRKITGEGTVSTLAAIGSISELSGPIDVATDAAGNVYVTESGTLNINHRIHKITPTGAVTVVAGSTAGYANGNGRDARFGSPYGIAVNGQGVIYVSDFSDSRIRVIRKK